MSMQTLSWFSGTSKNNSSQTAKTGPQAPSSLTVRQLRTEYINERLRMAHNANQAHHLYLELAARAKTEENKALYQRLAESEQRHLFRHLMRLRKLGHKPPKFQHSWLAKAWHRVLAVCAPTYAHNQLATMRREETRRQIEFIRRQSDMRPRQMAAAD